VSGYHIEIALDERLIKTRVCEVSLWAQGWRPVVSIPRHRRFELAGARQEGYTLYCDGDFVFLRDPRELFARVTPWPDVPVWCVQHAPYDAPARKKDGEPNEWYERKNWSSLMIFNHAHPACQQIPAGMTLPELHRFRWVEEPHYVGELPSEWNVLAGVHDEPRPAAIHYTHGTPDERDYTPSPYHDHYLGWLERAYATYPSI